MSENMYYGKLQRLFFEFYNRGDYQAALAFLEDNGPAVPTYSAIVMAWKAGMYCLTGDGASGLRLLEEAYDTGCWYHEEALANDPDYAALKEYPAFQDLLKRFHERREAEEAELIPHLSILEPPAATPQPWPLLIALHGNLSNAAEFASTFKSAAEQGWLVAVPQSHDPTWVSGHYDWRDYGSACRDIQNHIGMIKNRYQIDPTRTVLTGYSMGGQIGLQAALSGDVPARGFIGIEGWILDEELFQRVLKTTTQHDLRVYLVSGSAPQFYDNVRIVQEQLIAAGIACEVEFTSNEYHRVPEEISETMGRAFAYIFG